MPKREQLGNVPPRSPIFPKPFVSGFGEMQPNVWYVQVPGAGYEETSINPMTEVVPGIYVRNDGSYNFTVIGYGGGEEPEGPPIVAGGSVPITETNPQTGKVFTVETFPDGVPMTTPANAYGTPLGNGSFQVRYNNDGSPWEGTGREDPVTPIDSTDDDNSSNGDSDVNEGDNEGQ